jgi:hypothetical protein
MEYRGRTLMHCTVPIRSAYVAPPHERISVNAWGACPRRMAIKQKWLSSAAPIMLNGDE